MNDIPTREQVYQALEERHGKIRQGKLRDARVAICGLGGLGSNIAIALARAGVGCLHLIDFDKVDITNINRQQYKLSQIGMDKTEALKNNLYEIAPYCEVITDIARVDESNIEELLRDDHIICEAFDKAEAKAMLVNKVLESMPDKYLVAGSGMAGFSSANDIVTRKVTDKFYICGDRVNDVNDGIGLVASRVMVCAAHEAHMVIRIISGETTV